MLVAVYRAESALAADARPVLRIDVEGTLRSVFDPGHLHARDAVFEFVDVHEQESPHLVDQQAHGAEDRLQLGMVLLRGELLEHVRYILTERSISRVRQLIKRGVSGFSASMSR